MPSNVRSWSCKKKKPRPITTVRKEVNTSFSGCMLRHMLFLDVLSSEHTYTNKNLATVYRSVRVQKSRFRNDKTKNSCNICGSIVTHDNINAQPNVRSSSVNCLCTQKQVKHVLMYRKQDTPQILPFRIHYLFFYMPSGAPARFDAAVRPLFSMAANRRTSRQITTASSFVARSTSLLPCHTTHNSYLA